MGIITTASERGPRGAQEDRLVVVSLRDGWLLAVLDGHNGSAVSDLCAKRLPALAQDVWVTSRKDTGEYNFLRTIIQVLHDETLHHAAGSTISLVHINEEEHCVDVAVLGDSPVIISLKDDRFWVSTEHNVRSHAEDRQFVESRGALVDRGYISIPEDGYTSGLQLSRALGDARFDKYLIREPDCSSIELDSESVVAVMSDGVYDPRTIRRAGDLVSLPIKDALTVVSDALKRGTHDNVSAIVWRA